MKHIHYKTYKSATNKHSNFVHAHNMQNLESLHYQRTEFFDNDFIDSFLSSLTTSAVSFNQSTTKKPLKKNSVYE